MAKKIRSLVLIRLVSVLISIACFLIVLKAVREHQSLLFENSDFEHGDLSNWVAEGEAFNNQPTYGDNTMARRKEPSGAKGNYWIGTYEDRHTPENPTGKIQGDLPKGRLMSIPFTIRGGSISFWIGGGNDNALESVVLEVDGEVIRSSFGDSRVRKSETMKNVVWDVAKQRGKKAKIIITDEDQEGWAHINVDDFRYC